MPTWSGILNELLNTRAPSGQPDFDGVRRKYLASLHAHTGRSVILYATKWTQGATNVDPDTISINDEDLQGLMEVIHGLPDAPLDLIVHSPGGSAEATEMVVQYLRSKFSHIRAIIPQAAMSAATMLVCAADEIVMGKHSALGPIDPQFIIGGPFGRSSVPAQAILDQFDLAREECKDPAKLGAWLPMLSQYGPALLKQCENALALAEDLVAEWLARWMFKGKLDAETIARSIAGQLRDHGSFKSHGRHITRDKAQAMGLAIVPLEADQQFQDLALSVFHATTHTFGATACVKIIENHLGKAFVKLQQAIQVPIMMPQAPQPVAPVPQGP
ncbi:MAG: hypothetical protein Q8Q85_08500 [Gemmatimonadales bacterium]|nr:hypothetical protein [Gemmatimonadales bacterium]